MTPASIDAEVEYLCALEGNDALGWREVRLSELATADPAAFVRLWKTTAKRFAAADAVCRTLSLDPVLKLTGKRRDAYQAWLSTLPEGDDGRIKR